MRAWRERPRVAVATLLAVIIVVGGAGLIGSTLAGGVDDSVLAKEKRQSRALSSQLQTALGELSDARGQASEQLAAQQRANSKLKRARHRSTRDGHKIQRLRRQLRRARR